MFCNDEAFNVSSPPYMNAARESMFVYGRVHEYTVSVCACICVCVCVYTNVFVRVCLCVCMFACYGTYMCVHACVWFRWYVLTHCSWIHGPKIVYSDRGGGLNVLPGVMDQLWVCTRDLANCIEYVCKPWRGVAVQFRLNYNFMVSKIW